MTQTLHARDYEPPTVTDYGRVGAVTLSNSVHFGISLAQTFATSVVPTSSGGGGNNVTATLPATNTVVPGPGTGSAPGAATNTIINHPGTSGTSPSTVTSVPSGGSGSGPAAATGGGGKLPFTGLPVLYVAGAGAALVSAGEAVRRAARRRAADEI
jgi:hypothetical protein